MPSDGTRIVEAFCQRKCRRPEVDEVQRVYELRRRLRALERAKVPRKTSAPRPGQGSPKLQTRMAHDTALRTSRMNAHSFGHWRLPTFRIPAPAAGTLCTRSRTDADRDDAKKGLVRQATASMNHWPANRRRRFWSFMVLTLHGWCVGRIVRSFAIAQQVWIWPISMQQSKSRRSFVDGVDGYLSDCVEFICRAWVEHQRAGHLRGRGVYDMLCGAQSKARQKPDRDDHPRRLSRRSGGRPHRSRVHQPLDS